MWMLPPRKDPKENVLIIEITWIVVIARSVDSNLQEKNTAIVQWFVWKEAVIPISNRKHIPISNTEV